MARLQREILVEATTPDGEPLTLTVENGEHVVRVRGQTLMSSRCSGSEQAMATLACPQGLSMDDARVLVGGLGLGFTLRAMLDQVSANTRITVVELLALVVDWNRGPLGACAGRPLDDPRVNVHVGDLLDYLAVGGHAFDAILLDIDNGPEAFTVRSNARLYHPPGLALLRGALRAGGVLVVWSAFRSQAFEQRLRQAGFDARSATARARFGVRKGPRHTLFVAS